MSKIDVNKCLPPELTIESVDDILYRIGLYFTSFRVRPKLHFIDHPLNASIILLLFLIQRVITLLLSEKHHQIF